MNPEREGYISLEEETTSDSSQSAASPSEVVPCSPTSADADAVLSDGSSDEIAEAGVPEEPCFFSNGSARSNRQWLGWKPDTPRMPPKRMVAVEQQQTCCSSPPTQVDRQPQVPPRGIEHEEFCRDMNGVPLPRDHEERKNFDQLETFILGQPALTDLVATYMTASTITHMKGSQGGRRYLLISSALVAILKTMTLFMS